MKTHGRRLRQDGAINRMEISILKYEEELKSGDADEKKLLNKKIERARTTIANTKAKLV
jgi:hypothetical protein